MGSLRACPGRSQRGRKPRWRVLRTWSRCTLSRRGKVLLGTLNGVVVLGTIKPRPVSDGIRESVARKNGIAGKDILAKVQGRHVHDRATQVSTVEAYVYEVHVGQVRFSRVRPLKLRLPKVLAHGESAGSCAVSCAGCLGLIILVDVVLVRIGVLLGVSVYGGVSPAYNGPQ